MVDIAKVILAGDISKRLDGAPVDALTLAVVGR
jgi:hypothetical protein